MKVLILSGFLGAGKTSALLPLARYAAERSTSAAEHKVMILENEVGEIGIDDAFLRSGGLRVDTLFSGCACCTVAGELVYAVSRIHREYDPEWLILETTGVAYPRSIQQSLLNVFGLEARIVVLVDAARWKRLLLPMTPLLSGQIVGSDAVLVNKIDLLDPAAIEAVDADILGFEPAANILHISAIQPVAHEIWDSVLGI